MTDTQEILSNLIQEALDGEPLSFELIKSMQEFIRFCYRRISLKAIIRILSSCSKQLLKGYCLDIEAGTQDATKLLACVTIRKAVDFYKQDLLTIDQMLGEYESYLMTGNQLDFLLLRPRGESKLWDHRRCL